MDYGRFSHIATQAYTLKMYGLGLWALRTSDGLPLGTLGQPL